MSKTLTTEQMANECVGTYYYQEGFSWQEFARKARRFVRMEQREKANREWAAFRKSCRTVRENQEE